MRWVLVVLAAATLACNAATLAPSVTETPEALAGGFFSIPFGGQRFGRVVINVHDETGLVQGVVELGRPGDLTRSTNAVAVSDHDAKVIRLAWLGGACFNPLVTLTGDPENFLILVRASATGGPPPGAECPAVGIFQGIALSVAQPIDQEAIQLRYTP